MRPARLGNRRRRRRRCKRWSRRSSPRSLTSSRTSPPSGKGTRTVHPEIVRFTIEFRQGRQGRGNGLHVDQRPYDPSPGEFRSVAPGGRRGCHRKHSEEMPSPHEGGHDEAIRPHGCPGRHRWWFKRPAISENAAGACTGGVEGETERRDWSPRRDRHSFGTRTISMRRFVPRPSSVALSATDLNSPKAAAESLVGSMPCFWRYRATLIARAADSSQLVG